jgi:HEAT repeat protein
LGQIGDPRAVKPLIKALQDQNLSVCSAVVEALGLIGDLEALPHLLKIERREKALRRSTANVARKAINQIKAASIERSAVLKTE